MMKIAAPVADLREVEMLLHNGADELYCGIQLPTWAHLFGDTLWMNRRSPARGNLCDWESLSLITKASHKAGARVNLALNTACYPQAATAHLLDMIRKSVGEIGVDAVIISDVNLLHQLATADVDARIHLSSLGGCFNSPAVDFFRELGVRRIILPRQLRLDEMAAIVRSKCNEMEFEVFALNDGCCFEEGFCQTAHALGPFCLSGDPSHPMGFVEIEENRSGANLARLREYLWFQNNCGSSFQEDGLPNGPCALCAFDAFAEWGVKAVKIVGREASFHRKMAGLQLVRAVIEEMEKGRSAAVARRFRNTPDLCNSGQMCYFKECRGG